MNLGDRRSVKADTDPTAVRHAFAGMNGFPFGWFNPDGRLTVEELSEHYPNLLLNGLLTRRDYGHHAQSSIIYTVQSHVPQYFTA